jgi:hypothetical protein
MVGKSNLRLRISLWSMALALLPNTLAFLVFYLAGGYLYSEDFHWMIIAAACSFAAAGVSGPLFGRSLVDPTAAHDISDAIITGLKVAIGTHALWSLLLAYTAAISILDPLIQDGRNVSGLGILFGPLLVAVMFFLGSLWFLGWFTLILGGAAGYYLSKHYRRLSVV